MSVVSRLHKRVRWLESAYHLTESVFRRLDPLFSRIGYDRATARVVGSVPTVIVKWSRRDSAPGSRPTSALSACRCTAMRSGRYSRR